MKWDKKSIAAGEVKDKMKILINILEKSKLQNDFYDGYAELYKLGILISPDTRRFPCGEEILLLNKHIKGKYFTDEQKDIIIDYLMDCLVNEEPFDCSTLGPNVYLNEKEDNNDNTAISNSGV